MISAHTPSSGDPDEVALLKLLAHPARLAILDALRTGEECVCHLEALLGYRQAYLSQQLAVLREAGLVTDQRNGWNIYYQVANRQIYAVIDAVRTVVHGKPAPISERRSSPRCPCPKCSAQRAGQTRQISTNLTLKEN